MLPKLNPTLLPAVCLAPTAASWGLPWVGCTLPGTLWSSAASATREAGARDGLCRHESSLLGLPWGPGKARPGGGVQLAQQLCKGFGWEEGRSRAGRPEREARRANEGAAPCQQPPAQPCMLPLPPRKHGVVCDALPGAPCCSNGWAAGEVYGRLHDEEFAQVGHCSCRALSRGCGADSLAPAALRACRAVWLEPAVLPQPARCTPKPPHPTPPPAERRRGVPARGAPAGQRQRDRRRHGALDLPRIHDPCPASGRLPG